MRGPHTVPVCAVVALGAFVQVHSCDVTFVELDRMEGTAFPVEQQLGGSSHTLKSIYNDAGKTLAVDQDDSDIDPLDEADLVEGKCITDAELDSLEAGNRHTQVERSSHPCRFLIFEAQCHYFYVYGIVVNHFATDRNGSCKKTVRGRMWTTDNRRAFALFYKNPTLRDGKKFLRTAAHELGHAFNLHHQDGGMIEVGERRLERWTIMSLGGGDAFVYEFSDQSQDHLGNHLIDCVYPGTGRFKSVNEEHGDWHEGVNSNCEP